MFRDKTFEYRYSQLDLHQPIDFCDVALSNSIELKIGMGYFSSTSFNVLANSFARFISNGGKMSLYINQYISKNDFELLKTCNHIDFEERLINSFEELKKTFSIRDEHFFQCLSYLIATNRLVVKILVLNNGGLPHEKYGIFTDEYNDKIYFVGSMNMTGSAIVNNLETLECTCSWKGEDSLNKVLSLEKHFENIWNGNSKDVKIYEARYFCSHILKTYPNQDPENLLYQEQLFEENYINNIKTDLYPHFPSKYPLGPKDYQIEAYEAWVNREKRGVFAMATGTGKTITSLNCALNEYKIDGYYNLIILVPTLVLAEQWISEIKSFNFSNIIEVSSLNPKWRIDLPSLVFKLRRKSTDFVVVATYDSFVNDDFQMLLPTLSPKAILIADEAHNIGGESVLKAFRKLSINRRIALTATPKRIYDEEGTREIEDFFSDCYPYTYSFSMERAINENRLTKYYYYPKVAYLNEQELTQYISISNELTQLYDNESKDFKNKQLAKILLMKRKRIIQKAEDKLRVYRNIINEIGEKDLKYTFVYSPQGKYENEETENTSFVNKLLSLTKAEFPNKTCSSFTGEDSKSIRNTLLSSFEKGKLDILIAMKCLDEGVDVPRAEIGIFTASSGNPREFIQRRGRLLRTHPDKKNATIYDIIVLPKIEMISITNIERNLLRSELQRVAHFANLALNKFSLGGAIDTLSEIALRYGISISELINNIDN